METANVISVALTAKCTTLESSPGGTVLGWGVRYPTDEVADAVLGVLAAREAALRLEQAVYGLDALDELGMQALLAEGLARGGRWSVAREVHYPSSRGRKLTARNRCDLVLTPAGRPLRLDSRPPSLFDPPDQADPGEALWLEVKLAHQFAEGGRSHRGYGQQWRTGVVNDLLKMQAEEPLREAGLLLVVFTDGPGVLDKDLEHLEDTLAVREVLAGFRQVRSLPIVERNGHTLASVALWPTVQKPDPAGDQ